MTLHRGSYSRHSMHPQSTEQLAFEISNPLLCDVTFKISRASLSEFNSRARLDEKMEESEEKEVQPADINFPFCDAKNGSLHISISSFLAFPWRQIKNQKEHALYLENFGGSCLGPNGINLANQPIQSGVRNFPWSVPIFRAFLLLSSALYSFTNFKQLLGLAMNHDDCYI